MASQKNEGNWSRIRQGVRDAEKLITQRDYNAAMIKCRQTMEFMVKQLAVRAHIRDQSDLKSLIDDLYINRWISKSTYEHFNTIRIVGNKAVHDGYDNAYDATQAYQLLAQEATQFSNSYSNSPKGTVPKRSDSKRSDQSSSSSQRQSSSRSRRRQDSSRSGRIDSVTLIKLLVPVLCVILLILIIWMVRPRKTVVEETVPVSSFAETMAPMPTAAPQQTQETAPVYRTTSNLNVRSEPSTDSDILGMLNANAVVDYIGAENDEWARISYDGQEAFVASEYLTTE